MRDPYATDPRLAPPLRALRAGRLGEARQGYESVIAKAPDLAEARFGLAYTCMMARRPDMAIEPMRKAVELAPESGEFHHALAMILRSLGDIDGALEHYQRAAELSTKDPYARVDLAATYEQLGRFEEARSELVGVLEAFPDEQRANVYLTRLDLRLGRLDDDEAAARRAQLKAIVAKPGNQLVDSEANDVLIDLAQRAGDHAAAFGHMARMNRVEAERQPPVMRPQDRGPFLKLIGMQADGLYEATVRRWQNQQPDDGLPAPALLVGFPRSGTTMTERALDAHPGLWSIEEKRTFEQTKVACLQALGAGALQKPIVQVLDALTTDQVAALRQHYWQQVREQAGDPPEGALVLDKMPLRLTELSFVNRLFPDARVLVALRDPRDVCLSCFRQRFELNRMMSFFLDLQQTAQLYEAVMGGWLRSRDGFGFRWKQIRYEDTVAEFEPRIREMLEFLGLPWDDAVLSFHERTSEKASITPSYHAIRKGVNTKAVGRWRRHEAELAPILPTLEPFVEAFGYEPSGG